VILAEVFAARPSGVEEMMRLRLEERNWGEEERWPEMLCIGESPSLTLGSWIQGLCHSPADQNPDIFS
jgi:hypothetical protein